MLKASLRQHVSLINLHHLCTVTPLPDFPLAAATGQVRSPALSVFSALRGYPERRGEVPGAQRATAATLQLCSRAAHALCERVLKLKLKARAPSCRAHRFLRTCDSVPCSTWSLPTYSVTQLIMLSVESLWLCPFEWQCDSTRNELFTKYQEAQAALQHASLPCINAGSHGTERPLLGMHWLPGCMVAA